MIQTHTNYPSQLAPKPHYTTFPSQFCDHIISYYLASTTSTRPFCCNYRFPAANVFIDKRIRFLKTRKSSRRTDTLGYLAECYHAQGYIDKALDCTQGAVDSGESSLEVQWHHCLLKRQADTMRQQQSMLSSVSMTTEDLCFPSPAQVG